MANWSCVERCGACCHLDPIERPDIQSYLTPTEYDHYLSLVGPDGWCIHFDAEARKCQIYANRPQFCRVQTDVFQRLFGVEPEELNDFAIDCCRDQIDAIYGDRSLESLRFEQAIGL
ncbi:MAG: YkgJ family cysteine cluster protein [Acaryochloridaceae cyanobacterium SU_2_1]|nr:YkgJ family cysteine cluster protein [Acaryochloridaceae cyanobacterium SU_2_1]